MLECPDGQVHRTVFYHWDMHPNSLQQWLQEFCQEIWHPDGNNRMSKIKVFPLGHHDVLMQPKYSKFQVFDPNLLLKFEVSHHFEKFMQS